MRIEDYYGTGLTFAAVAHLAQGLPARATFALYDYHMPEAPLALNPLSVSGGRVSLPPDCGPGLGVEINETILGEPLAVFEP
jgi:L-alanine-DL-glutamate epimerase-like enolase superfamily enzyme